jgi:hypothetical protein
LTNFVQATKPSTSPRYLNSRSRFTELHNLLPLDYSICIQAKICGLLNSSDTNSSLYSVEWLMAGSNKLERMYTDHAWSDCEKPRTSSVRIVGVTAKNRTRHFPRVSQKLYGQIQLRFNTPSSSP